MKHDRIVLYLRILFVLLGALAATLSLKVYIADSEFWAVTASHQLGQAGASASIYMKVVFYGLLKALYFLPLDNLSLVLVARLEFAAIAALTAFVFLRIAKRALGDDLAALVLTLVLVSCSFFMTQSFRIRSDNLASMIFLLVLWSTLGWQDQSKSKWMARAFAVAALNVLLLIVTPKSFYFLLIGLVFAVFLPIPSLDRRRKLSAVALAFVTPPFLIFSAFELGALVPALRWAERAYRVALEYFFDSFSGSVGVSRYLSGDDFAHVFIFLKQNPIHDFFLLASLALWASRWREIKGERRAYFAMFFASLLLLIFHNQKLPFFIFAILPPLFLGAGFVWKDIWSRFTSHRRFAPALAICLALFFLTAASATHRSISINSNDLQISTLKPLQEFLSEEKPNYYDAIGLFPRLNRIYAFPSPSDRNNPVIMRVVSQAKPDLILYVTRTLELEPAFGFFLGESYVDLGGGIWLRSVTPSKLSKKVRAAKNGDCTLKLDDAKGLALGAFGTTKDPIQLYEVDSVGFVAIEKSDLVLDSLSGPIKWKCENKSFALARVRPRAIPHPFDLRFLFGFDASY